ncbi:MAG: histidine kinase [Saprospiraceae bacterium]|nr:histidine kinase [Saprospiraceae bacterium]
MKTCIKKISQVFLLVIWYWIVSGQSYYIESIGKESGLTYSTVNHIYQDTKGFIWFNTSTGLIHYSGSYSKKYLPGKEYRNEIKSEYYYYCTEDQESNLWFATRNGLMTISADRKIIKTFYHNSSDSTTIPNDRIFDLLKFNDSILFLACDRSPLVTFNTKSNIAKCPNPEMNFELKNKDDLWVRQLFRYNDSILLIRASGGFFRYNVNKNSLTAFKDSLTGFNQILRKTIILHDDSGIFWLTDQDGVLYKWSPDKEMKKFDDPELNLSLKKGEIRFFDFDHQNLWISASNQNYIFNKDSGKYHKINLRNDHNEELSNERVTALFRTKEGIVFISFKNGTTGQINPLHQCFQYTAISDIKKGPPLYIPYVIEDTLYKKRYISTFLDSFIFIQHLQDGTITKIPKRTLNNNSSNKILLDSQGKLWITQDEGIFEIDRAKGTTTFYQPEEKANLLFDIEEISPGKLIVGSFKRGLFWFEPEKKIFKKIPETKGWISTQVFNLKYDPSHDVLWIGTVRNGLFKYDIGRDSFIQYLPDTNNPKSIGGDWARTITIDSAGFVWIATDPVGLCRFDYNAEPGKEFTNYSIKDGIPSNYVGGLGVTKDGTLWLSSFGGLASVSPKENKIRTYEIDGGFYNHSFYYANLNVSQKNSIHIGTEKGYISFHPECLQKDTIMPEVFLMEFEIQDRKFNKKVDVSGNKEIRLSYNENYFRIEFAVVNYTNPKNNIVYYKLDNSTSDWQIIKESNHIYFSKLSPGQYTFRLKAQNGDGVWSRNEINIPIIIKPPFWQTWWFLSIILSVIGFMVFWGYRYQLKVSIKENHLKSEQQMIKSEMEKEITKLEMIALRSQMNPHFIFNCLNSINRFIIVNDNETASEYLTKFSRLIRQVLDNSRSEKITLARELDTLNLYIEMEKLRFVDKFEYFFTISTSVQSELIFIQPMLIQPYIENAIWHGLMHKKEKGILTVNVFQKENKLCIIIEDNGIGREKAMELKSRHVFQDKSHGMKVTAERLAIQNRKPGDQSEIIVTDLKDEFGNPTGTSVEISLSIS